MNKKTNATDLMKFLFSIIILITHIYFLIDKPNIVMDIFVQGFVRMGPVFFMILSFYFFFQKLQREGVELSDKKKAFPYLMSLLRRIIVLYGVWSVPYLLISLVSLYGRIPADTIMPQLLWQFLYAGSFYHLWYFPPLIFGAVIFWILSTRFPSKAVGVTAVLCWITGLLGSQFINVIPGVPLIGSVFRVYREMFETTANGVFLGFPMAFLACRLAARPVRQNTWKIALFTAVFAVLCCADSYHAFVKGWTVPTGSHISIFMAPFALFLIVLLQRIPMPASSYNVFFRKSSILIYTMHPIVLIVLVKLKGFSFASMLYNNMVFLAAALIITIAAAAFLIWISDKKHFRWIENLL